VSLHVRKLKNGAGTRYYWEARLGGEDINRGYTLVTAVLGLTQEDRGRGQFSYPGVLGRMKKMTGSGAPLYGLKLPNA